MMITNTSHGRSSSPASDTSGWIVAFAVLVGLTIPMIFLGRSVLAISAGLALICLPFVLDRRRFAAETTSLASSPAGLLIVATALLWLLGLFNSPDAVRSLTTELRCLFFIAASTMVWHVLRSEEFPVDTCLRVFIVSSAVLSLYAVIGITSAPGFVSFVRGHGWSSLYQASIGLKETGSAAAMMIFVAAYAGWRLPGAMRLLSLFVVAGFVAVILLTGSRAGLAGLAAAIVAVWICVTLRARSSRILVGGLVIGMGFVALIVKFLLHIKQTRFQFSGEKDALLPYWIIDAPRQGIWEKTLEVSEPYRWTGFGINMINRAPGADTYNTVGGTVYVPAHPHNWMVEVLAETGVLGFTSLLACIAVFSTVLMRRYLRTGHITVLAAIGVWSAYWTSGLFNFSYWSAWWQLAFYFLMAVCLAIGSEKDVFPATGGRGSLTREP